jgi:signal transduction histidine kinase
VRNPINNITVGLELVASSLPPDDPNQENIKRMLQDCDRLIDQMKAVLSFARPTEYVMETLDVGVLLQRLLDRMRNRTNSLNIQYSLQIEQDCPKIQGNMRALEQVFNNLFNNAVQAMDESGGCLAVKVQSIPIAENHPYLEVSVADTGPGIPPEQLERVFQPFFTTKKTGTGLGLAISKRIITAHKGNISVNSFPGGTIFRLQFPIPNLNAARTDHG